MIEHLGLALTTFALTNVDDLLVLALYFAKPAFRVREVVAGQYIGVLALVGLSLIGLVLGALFSPEWIGLLGLAPIFLGTKALLQLVKHRQAQDHAPATQELEVANKAGGAGSRIWMVAVVTFANGGTIWGFTPLYLLIWKETTWFFIW